MTRRISTAAFAARAASRLGESGHKLNEALHSPQIADVLATLDGPRPLKAMLIGPVQVFKSAVGQLHLARNMVVRPGWALWYNITEDDSKDFAGQKLNPLLEAQPKLAGLSLKDKSKSATLRRNLANGASVLLLSSSKERDRHSKTARDIYIDEMHQIDQPGAIAQIRNRHGAFPDEYLEFGMSTGLVADTEADLEYNSTDKRLWHVRCPECKKLFEHRFAFYSEDGGAVIAGIRYEKHYLDDGMPNERLIKQSLHYECPRCHAHLPDTDQTRLAMSGTRDKPVGIYVITNENAEANCVSWNFSALSVRAWLPIVMRFEKAMVVKKRGDLTPLSKLIMEELAGRWDPNFFMKRNTSRPVAQYKMGDDWDCEDKANPLGSRFCAIDLQQDYYVLVIRMWGKASASRLRFCAQPKSVSEINEILKAHSVEKRHVFMDSRHDGTRARRLAAMMGWNTIQGDGRTEGTAPKTYLHEDGLRRIYDEEPKLLDAHIGTLEEGQGRNVYEWLFSKQSALDRLHLLRTETYAPDPTHPDRLEPLHACPIDAPEWYWKQATAHTRKTRNNTDGTLTQIWFGSHDDHAEDCEAIGVTIATMAGLTGAETVPTPDKPPSN